MQRRPNAQLFRGHCTAMANGNGYTEMREEFEELRRGIAKDIAAQREASAERWRQERARDLAAQKADAQAWRQEFAKDMAAQIASSAGDLRREMSDGFAAQNADAQRWRQEVLTGVDERFAGLDQRMKIQAEELRDLVKVAAEGYGGTLDSIRREIAELRAALRPTLASHDKTLRSHARRIAKLERR